MAIIRAVKTGNWSDSTVWAPSPPTANDDVFSNTFTVTIDVSPTVLQISNASTTGVTAGGGFVISADGITLNCTGAGIVIGANATCLTVNIPSPSVATIFGNCVGGDRSFHCVNNASSGTLNITGNCTGCSGGNAGANNASSGTLNITGNCTGGGGTGNGGPGARNGSIGTLSITGNCTGGGVNNAIGATNNSTGTLNITGNCIGGWGSTTPGAINNSTGTLNITGNCIGGSGQVGAASNGTLVHIGSVLASTAAAGIGGGSAGQVTILTGPLLSTDGTGALAAATGVNPCTAARWFPADTALGTFEYVMRGATVSGSPSARPARRLLFQEAYDSLYPAAGNVRTGTSYGPTNIYTGTCAVPPAGSVAFGVPVDATTGTAAIDGASIRSALGLASANLDAQFAAIPAAPSAAAIRAELDSNSTKLANLDTTISSRLATSGYTTPPTASAITAAVWAAADKTGYSLTSTERQAIATAVEQSILNENDGQAILNAIVGAIGNQNIDQVALVAAIRADLERNGGTLATRSTLTAAQVRTELTPELGNLDATVSSRLAASGYTAPPSAASIATAVWSAATRTLTTAIDNSSNIAAAVWSYATGRTITGGTVDTLTNAPTVPSAAAIASQVRTELTTELSRIDATVSSRLAPAGTLARVTLVDTTTTLTNAPDVPTEAEIADAVRTELAPELARVANCATVQTTGNQIAALS